MREEEREEVLGEEARSGNKSQGLGHIGGVGRVSEVREQVEMKTARMTMIGGGRRGRRSWQRRPNWRRCKSSTNLSLLRLRRSSPRSSSCPHIDPSTLTRQHRPETLFPHHQLSNPETSHSSRWQKHASPSPSPLSPFPLSPALALSRLYLFHRPRPILRRFKRPSSSRLTWRAYTLRCRGCNSKP